MCLRFMRRQVSVLKIGELLGDRGLCGEEDGEHGHEPEGKGEVEVLGVGEAADEGEEEEGGGEGFEVRRRRRGESGGRRSSRARW